MYVRAAGISKEVGEELVKRLKEFGWDARDTGTTISINGHGQVEESAQGKTTHYGISMEVPIDTILEVVYYTSGGPIKHESMGRNEELIDTEAPIESITLNLGTRSELSFFKDGVSAVKI
jgi:hypothetical protein